MKSRQIFAVCGVALAIQLGVLGSLVRKQNQVSMQARAPSSERVLLDKVEVSQGAPERKPPGEVPQMRANPGDSNDIK